MVKMKLKCMNERTNTHERTNNSDRGIDVGCRLEEEEKNKKNTEASPSSCSFDEERKKGWAFILLCYVVVVGFQLWFCFTTVSYLKKKWLGATTL